MLPIQGTKQSAWRHTADCKIKVMSLIWVANLVSVKNNNNAVVTLSKSTVSQALHTLLIIPANPHRLQDGYSVPFGQRGD